MGPRLLLWLAVLAVGLSAQETPVFQVDVDVVQIFAAVRDRDGRVATDLSREDFVLELDGAPQEIRYFARQSDLPLTIGILVDTSLSQRRLMKDQRTASVRFLRQVLRPDVDQAFVIRFDREAELVQDVTGTAELIEKALSGLDVPSPFDRRRRLLPEDVASHQFPGRRRRAPGSRGPARVAGTVLYDAVFLAAEDVLSSQTGRKALVLLSDGVDVGSKVSLGTAIESAQRHDAIVYSVRYYDRKAYARFGGRGGKSETTLTRLADESGGRMFEVSDKLPLERIFTTIQEELRNQYSIGFVPSDTARAGYRKIQLRTIDTRLKVQTRDGYYADHPPAKAR
ncbi:MAG: VWA domain-containing protein [Bryobacterales bacterium]|nr:VWA domain-containing protein [Bryobacterales bacterium]